MQEEKLTGGRITADVVRVGETVHRTHNANSDFVKAVLIHLENKAVDFAPRWLGMDEQGRDVFSYMPGSVPDNLGEHSDEQCAAAARMIARIHVSLSDMPGCTDGLTVCHRDLSPCNFVFDKDMPVGIIDWDAAAVGNPINDLAYTMWMWLDIGNDEQDARGGRTRPGVIRFKRRRSALWTLSGRIASTRVVPRKALQRPSVSLSETEGFFSSCGLE